MFYVLLGKHNSQDGIMSAADSISFLQSGPILNCSPKKMEQLYKEIRRDTDTGMVGGKCVHLHNLIDHRYI